MKQLLILTIAVIMFGSCKKCKDCHQTTTVYVSQNGSIKFPPDEVAETNFRACNDMLTYYEENEKMTIVSEHKNGYTYYTDIQTTCE